MGCLYKRHEDEEFLNAISDLQDRNTKPLDIWIGKQKLITDTDKIIEILHQLFMISDSFFQSGTSNTLTTAIMMCKPQEKIKYLGANILDFSVWLEEPNDFRKLFNAFDKSFCSEDAKVLNNKFKNTSEYFSCQKLDNSQGFWKAIGDFHSTVFYIEINNSNLPENINTWLTQVPKAYEFVKPYCPYLTDEINFSHIAYAYLNHGCEIEKDILGLFPRENPKPYDVFKKAAEYCELNAELYNKENILINNNKIKI